MNFNIAVMPGDGIGPEIVEEAKKILDTVGSRYGHSFNYTEVKIGGISIDTYFQHHNSFISNSNLSLHPRGISHIPR